jgi:hypothetical protein
LTHDELGKYRRYLINILANLLDHENPKWTWGCEVRETGKISHQRIQHPEAEVWVDPEEWGNSRLGILERDKTLPDYSNSNVLPREAGGLYDYDEVADNIKKQTQSPFEYTKREDWLTVQGYQFHQMMTGDYGDGIQRLDFGKGDLMIRGRNREKTWRTTLFRSNDIDSGMGWLSDLGVIKSDVILYLYPISSRNFDSSLHLYTNINGKNTPVHLINHFLLGQFGSISVNRSFNLYLFLPNLYRNKPKGYKGNGVIDKLKDTFISECLIPAAREILSDFHLEQFGNSMSEVKMDVEAPMYEGQISGSVGHRLAGGDTIVPEKKLGELWVEVRRNIERLGNPDLEDCRLFWNFKGLKYCLNGGNHENLERTVERKVNIHG